METIKKNTTPILIIENIVLGLLIAGAFFIYYTPDTPVFKTWAKYSSQITIIYWIIGLLFLVLKSTRLTMVAFVCCVFMCLHLKNTTSPLLTAPHKSNQPLLKIAHFNLSASNSPYKATIKTIQNMDADIISVQEVTPDWKKALNDSLNKRFPFHCNVRGTDFFTTELFSKYPFSYCDTFYCENMPNLLVGFKSPLPNQHIYIFSTYIAAPLFETASNMMRRQLDTLAVHVKKMDAPSIVLGEYNVPPFFQEIVNMRQITGLQDSRRGYRPTRNDGYISLLEVPTDHIFFTPHFDCIDFQTINGPNSEHLGIIGTYQMNRDTLFAQR
jgi:endonuclease/exonuclease/phosphatase (EEP) superfamily protein YafD